MAGLGVRVGALTPTLPQTSSRWTQKLKKNYKTLMRTYLELVESFKEYRALHEEPKTERVVLGQEGTRGRSSTPGQVLAEVLAAKEKGSSAIQQFLAQSEEILTNRRHSFKIDLKNPESSEATIGALLTFKDAFERFVGECDLIRFGREGARDQE